MELRFGLHKGLVEPNFPDRSNPDQDQTAFDIKNLRDHSVFDKLLF